LFNTPAPAPAINGVISHSAFRLLIPVISWYRNEQMFSPPKMQKNKKEADFFCLFLFTASSLRSVPGM
jgi:hypothetical protein